MSPPPSNLTPQTTRLPLTYINLRLKLLHNHGIWIESSSDQLIMVRYLLELTLRQNTFLLPKKMLSITVYGTLYEHIKYNQFDSCIVIWWFYLYENGNQQYPFNWFGWTVYEPHLPPSTQQLCNERIQIFKKGSTATPCGAVIKILYTLNGW